MSLREALFPTLFGPTIMTTSPDESLISVSSLKIRRHTLMRRGKLEYPCVLFGIPLQGSHIHSNSASKPTFLRWASQAIASLFLCQAAANLMGRLRAASAPGIDDAPPRGAGQHVILILTDEQLGKLLQRYQISRSPSRKSVSDWCQVRWGQRSIMPPRAGK